MSHRVDPKTQLFDDLTREEAVDLEVVVRKLVSYGTPCGDHPAFTAWCEALGFKDREILVMGVAFPQRALLSLITPPVGLCCHLGHCLRCGEDFPVDPTRYQGMCVQCIREDS